MSVVTSEAYPAPALVIKARCIVCGGKLRFPFVHWRGDTDICICGRCAHGIKSGLVADLIQCAAIIELHQAAPCYHAQTFERTTQKELVGAALGGWEPDP